MNTGRDLIDLVNPLSGSDSELGYSTGLVYPAVGTPWGMTYFSPRNRAGGHVFSRRRSWPINRIDGFTATHSPSPWMGDYGTFTLLPGVGQFADDPVLRDASYNLASEQSHPDYYRLHLNNGNIDCEMTATCRCAVMRLRYPTTTHARIALRLHSNRDEATVDQANRRITGIARNGPDVPGDFGCRFIIEIDSPIREVRRIPAAGGAQGGEDGDIVVITFDARSDAPVHARIATSFISTDQAALNLGREAGDRSFDQVRQATADLWQTELSRVRIAGGTEDQRRIFYTCLWRALLFPRTFHELDADEKVIHFSPYTGSVEPGPLVTDNGFWDTSRTVYPLLSLVWRNRLGAILDGWNSAYTESGWMPQWASPGHRACMVGTHSAAVFADAICKGITRFDREAAYASMVKDASIPGDPDGRYGRQQLREYLELGYCPEVGGEVGGRDSVCRTLDYSYNDWCCARVAEVLGRQNEAAAHHKRSGSWRNLFDPETKFFRPRKPDGSWAGPFEEFRWGGPYREGGPWQYRFAVPHDPHGLADALGGPDALAAELVRMTRTLPQFDTGHYHHEIHEMTEMAGASLGQYAHSNQPVHAFLWKAARVGRPDITDSLVRRVLEELYTPETFPGDEDNGEMGSWYVMASLGLGPHCPGDPSYTTVPPLFDEAELVGDDGRTIRLRGGGAGTDLSRNITHASLLSAAEENREVMLP